LMEISTNSDFLSSEISDILWLTESFTLIYSSCTEHFANIRRSLQYSSFRFSDIERSHFLLLMESSTKSFWLLSCEISDFVWACLLLLHWAFC
jgi:hypothetical protein